MKTDPGRSGDEKQDHGGLQRTYAWPVAFEDVPDHHAKRQRDGHERHELHRRLVMFEQDQFDAGASQSEREDGEQASANHRKRVQSTPKAAELATVIVM